MSKQALFIGAIASIIAINQVVADTTVTSKQYVDTTRQATIPTADTNYEANGGGVSVVTYTDNAGVLGERYICDADAEDNGYCNDDNLVTRDLLTDQIEQATDLPETTVTYKTCYREVNGDCILWNLSDRDVYGKCRTQDDCPPCDNGLARDCSPDGRCQCNDFE